MKLIPQSLFARVAIVLILTLVVSQLVSVALFRFYAREPRMQLTAIGFISQLKTIRAALETLPPERHQDFIQRIREERGIGILRVPEGEVLERAPDWPALAAARERLAEAFGAETEIYIRPRAKVGAAPALVVKLPAMGKTMYVVFPRARLVEPDFTLAWAGWAAIGGTLAVIGALFLMWRVNQPLKALAAAAREIGRGNRPAPVSEMGPSEVRAVANAFNQMQEGLARVDQERATFLAGVSHDLRTPLSRLRLGLEMLPADPATRKDLEHDIDDINSVVEQFMNFARDESSEVPESTDLNLMARDAANLASRRGATITLELDTLPAVTMRPIAIKRLIANLLDNAINHAGAEITLRTASSSAHISISVLDRGPGIPQDEVEHLKQPFTRRDKSRSGGSGAGLGLAIIERIAKMHGGKFELLPREGGGLHAIVTIPRAGG